MPLPLIHLVVKNTARWPDVRLRGEFVSTVTCLPVRSPRTGSTRRPRSRRTTTRSSRAGNSGTVEAPRSITVPLKMKVAGRTDSNTGAAGLGAFPVRRVEWGGLRGLLATVRNSSGQLRGSRQLPTQRPPRVERLGHSRNGPTPHPVIETEQGQSKPGELGCQVKSARCACRVN